MKHLLLLILALLGMIVPPCLFAQSLAKTGEQMQFADGLYRRNLYDMAVREYLTIVREDPDFDQMDAVYYRLAECYRQMESYTAADRFYQRLVAEYPDSTYFNRSRLRRAELFVQNGQYAASVELLADLLADDPEADTASGALYYMGYAYAELDNKRDAETAYQRLLNKHPDSAFASYARLELARMKSGEDRNALLEELAKNPASDRLGAEALFQLAVYDFEGADDDSGLKRFKKLEHTYPDEPRTGELALTAAWALQRKGLYADALEMAKKYGTKASTSAAWLYLEANAYRQLLDADAALETYARLRSDFPDSDLADAASYEAAVVLYNRKAYQEALDQLSTFTPTPELKTDYTWLMAECHAGLGHEDQAVQYYRMITDAEEAGPRAAESLFRLGWLLQQRGDYLEASKAYRRLAKEHPKSPQAPRALYGSALCQTLKEDPEEAISDWTGLIETGKDKELATEALYERGVLRAGLNEDKLALADFTAYLASGLKSIRRAEAWRWSGLLHARMGEVDKAEEAFRTALTSDPEPDLEQQVKLRLVNLLQQAGRPEESVDLLQDLIHSPLKNELPPALLEWLARLRLERKEYPLAISASEALLNAETADSAWKQIGYYLLGRAHLELGQMDEAQEALRQSMGQSSHTREGAEAAVLLGDLALKDGNLDAANTYYTGSAEAAVETELADVRAQSYFGLGAVEEARTNALSAARYYLSVAVLFDDTILSPKALYHAALQFEKAGRQREANQARAELQDRYPTSSWAKKLTAAEEGEN